MRSKIIVLDVPFSPKRKNDNTNVWWKTGKYFIRQENIRSLSRKGKRTRISLFYGEDVTVDVSYDKLSPLLPLGKKQI